MTTNGQKYSEDIAGTIRRYIELAIKHGNSTEDGNSDEANLAYKELEAVFERIVQSGNRDHLVPLLSHVNPAVRAKAAFHTYILDRRRAESVLEGVAASPGLVGFSAGMTLKQLRSGGLKPK